MKHILVTGCNGQLGNEIRELSHNFDTSYSFLFTDKEELDICDSGAVYTFFERHHIAVVVNCAAYTAVDKAESNVALCEQLNYIAPGYLAEAAGNAGATMIQISTDYVFDGIAHRPYSENDATNPITVYGRTKLAGEEAVIRGCPGSMVIRTAWLYSTYGNNFVKTMLRLGKEREELNVIADQIGTPTYARDLASAILTIIKQGIVPGVYHYTNQGACSWYDFACAILQLGGIRDCKVNAINTEGYPTPAKRPHYSVLDKHKIIETYNLEIPWWLDSLKTCMKHI